MALTRTMASDSISTGVPLMQLVFIGNVVSDVRLVNDEYMLADRH